MGYPSYGDGGKIARNPREKVLKSALEYVSKDRNTAYGEPEDNFQNIADVWNGMGFSREDGDPITATDVAKLMIGMKLARLKHNPTHEDSWTDIAGYAACGFQAAQRDVNNGGGKLITEGPFKGWRELGYTDGDGLVYTRETESAPFCPKCAGAGPLHRTGCESNPLAFTDEEAKVINEGASVTVSGVMPEYQAKVQADIEAVKRVADQQTHRQPMIGKPIKDNPQA